MFFHVEYFSGVNKAPYIFGKSLSKVETEVGRRGHQVSYSDLCVSS